VHIHIEGAQGILRAHVHQLRVVEDFRGVQITGKRRNVYVNMPLTATEVERHGEPIIRYARNKVNTTSEWRQKFCIALGMSIVGMEGMGVGIDGGDTCVSHESGVEGIKDEMLTLAWARKPLRPAFEARDGVAMRRPVWVSRVSVI
jgi:hypothetical protein